MIYEPFGNRVILRKVKEENKGMIIPKSASVEEKAIGEVVSVGEYPSILKINDRVIYDEFAGSLIPGEEDLTIIDVKYIFAIIKNNV